MRPESAEGLSLKQIGGTDRGADIEGRVASIRLSKPGIRAGRAL